MGEEDDELTNVVEVEVSASAFQSTGFLLAMAGAESAAPLGRVAGEADLRPSHYSALMVLGDRGALSQQELAGMIAVDPRNLVSVIDHLEMRGLVERRPHSEDRRRNALELTSAGRSLLARLAASGRELEKGDAFRPRCEGAGIPPEAAPQAGSGVARKIERPSSPHPE